jgi:hypothetical protein
VADTKRNIGALLEPYRGKRRALEDALGEHGFRMLVDYCDQSPMAVCEFLGYEPTTRGRVGKRMAQMGIEVHKRDPNDPYGEMTLQDWENHYLRITGSVERATECEWTLPEDHDEEYGRLHFLGDLHIGNPHQDSRRLLEFIGWLAGHPEDRWILLGDLFELRAKASPGEAPAIPQRIAFDLACKWLEPIMDQCLVCHTGNHDLRVARQTDMQWDPVRDFAREYGKPYGGMDGFHRLRLCKGEQEQVYVGYCHHGYGGARTAGARRNQLVQKLRDTNADYLAMAHLHDTDAGGTPVFGPDEDGIIGVWRKPVVRTGSWLKHEQGSHAREAGLPPGAIGAVTLHLYVSKHSAHARN